MWKKEVSVPMPTTKVKSIHSVRLDERLVKLCNETGLPLNNIIETCLVYFATLKDEERIKFLAKNDPDKLDYSNTKKPGFDYANKAIQVAKQELGDKPLGRISMKALIAIGLTLLAVMFLASNKDERGV